MELAISGVALPFEVTFQASGLPVAMSVYDVTSGSAVLVQGPTAMPNMVGSTYVGFFTGTNERTYLIFKAVYTDNSFTTLDPTYSQGTETIVVNDAAAGGGAGGSGQLVGVVLKSPVLIGIVEC